MYYKGSFSSLQIPEFKNISSNEHSLWTLDLNLTLNISDEFCLPNKFDYVGLHLNKLPVKNKHDFNFKILRTISWSMYLFSTIIYLILILYVYRKVFNLRICL